MILLIFRGFFSNMVGPFFIDLIARCKTNDGVLASSNHDFIFKSHLAFATIKVKLLMQSGFSHHLKSKSKG